MIQKKPLSLIFFFIARHLPIYFYYFFLYTVSACKFRPQESQSDDFGDLRRMISLVVGSFGHVSFALAGTWTCIPLTADCVNQGIRCLSLKPDMDGEVRSHPDSRISAKLQSWELGLSRVLRPDNHWNHPELRHVSSLYYRLRHQSFQTVFDILSMQRTGELRQDLGPDRSSPLDLAFDQECLKIWIKRKTWYCVPDRCFRCPWIFFMD
jgi:hypothetical protein